jgi:hypothetical protein
VLGAEGEAAEEESEGCEGKVFEEELATWGLAAAEGEAAEEDEVREREESEGDPEIEEEMCVECRAVEGRVGGQVPEAVGGRVWRGLHEVIVEGAIWWG